MRWCVIGLTLQLMLAPIAYGDEFRFSGGAPLDTYQARIIVSLLTEAFKREGHSFKAVHFPSRRSLSSSNSGDTDGELHRVHNFHSVSKGKYPNLVRIESELLRIATAVFSRDKNAVIGTLQDLSGHSIAYKRGRAGMASRLGKLPSPTRVFGVSSDLASMRMLANGNVDFIIMEFNEGNALIGADPKFKNIHSNARLRELRIYTYMNKRHSKVAIKIAAALEAMKSDGVFRKIVANSIKEYIASIKTKPANSAK